MHIRIWLLALVLALGSGSASALTADGYEGVPYVGGYGLFEFPDSDKGEKDSFGYRAFAGYPVGQNSSLEMSYFDSRLIRKSDNRPNYDSGLFVDYAYDFGLFGFGHGFLPNFKPYVLAGVGAERDDENGTHRIYHPAADVGAGLMFPISFGTWNWGWSLRTEGRVVAEYNDPGHHDDYVQSRLPIDYHVGIGLSIPLSFIFHRRHPGIAPAPECAAAVVDLVTGRSDCSGDSDGDGVPDDLDQCPGTLSGVKVDEKGCPIEAGNDEDGDGVLDSDDQCPHTAQGAKVDGKGCSAIQAEILEGVTFETNSAALSGPAMHVLDMAVQSLEEQADLALVIVGHTDNTGPGSYNFTLSDIRARSVRQYLIGKGVAPERISTKAYGEVSPVAPNDSKQDRAKNRRAELLLVVK